MLALGGKTLRSAWIMPVMHIMNTNLIKQWMISKLRVRKLGSGLVQYPRKHGLGMHLTQIARLTWLSTICKRCLTSTS